MTLDDIKAAIPHRPPFLWIDEIVEISDDAIHARKHLPADLDVFRGHYPHFPVFPGVLQCEACFQAGAILIARTAPADDGKVPVVTRQNNTQFRQMVRPDQTLDVHVELGEWVGPAVFLKGKVIVDGKTALRLEFACTMTAEQ